MLVVAQDGFREALRVSERLSCWDFAREMGDPVTDAFSLMNALVRGATNDGLCYGDPQLVRRYTWWVDEIATSDIAHWIHELTEWHEITVEPLGRNCYSPNETFPVIVIKNRRRFKRWHPRPQFTAAQRVEVYARDHGQCVYCGATENLSIDHIHPWSKGGAHELSNFQTLCRSCNSKKGNRI